MGDTTVRAQTRDIRAVYGRLFDANSPPSSLKESVASGNFYPSSWQDAYDLSAGMLPGRSILWKCLLLFRTPLAAASSNPPIAMLRKSREKYVELVKLKLNAPDGSFEEWVEIPGFDAHAITRQSSAENLARNNPLSLEEDSGWNDWFAGVDLRKTIRQDVERTFPDIPYFREQRVQSLLTTILYLHASLDPLVGYRQGMHELLAPLLYAVDFDSLDPTPASPSDASTDQLAELCDREWIAADAYALFEAVMSNIGVWYEWQEPPQPLSLAGGQMGLKPYVAPIVSACREIYDQSLKTCDPALWSALQRSQIEPQIYGIRWLRLLFTREFPIAQAMNLWDGLFAIDPSLQMSKWICVAMLIRIRNDLIPNDYTGQLTTLLRYPSHVPQLSAGSSSSMSLLLTQAQILGSVPNPTSGATVAMQNRDALGIPLEVPEPPAPPRRARPDRDSDRRRQSASTAAGPSRRSPQPGGSGVQAYANTLTSRIGSYADQYRKDQFGLPELLVKGLSDINGVVSNTVSEIRRNLPELQSRTSSPEIAFPYQSVTQTTEERPPWEPRSRFEIEREIRELQASNRKLGKALGWAVDALLQSGEGPEIDNRKREALECLAYVRDVLNTAKVPADLDEERLVSETELKRLRAEKKTKEKARREGAAAVVGEAAISTSSSAPSAPLPTIFNANRSRHSAPVAVAAGVPRSGSGPNVSLPSTRVSTALPFTSAPPRTLHPPDSHGLAPLPPGAVLPRIAPWHSTYSSFDQNNASAVLRRPAAASLVGPPQAVSTGVVRRRTSSNIGTEQSDHEGSEPPVTYQNDPLRG